MLQAALKAAKSTTADRQQDIRSGVCVTPQKVSAELRTAGLVCLFAIRIAASIVCGSRLTAATVDHDAATGQVEQLCGILSK